MLNSIRTTTLGYYASVGFYKTEEQVCCGNPFFYVVATRCHGGQTTYGRLSILTLNLWKNTSPLRNSNNSLNRLKGE
jgi:hypothetical protein